MHYSIQQEFARTRHADLLKEAEQARLAAIARQDGREPRFGRLSGLLDRIQRQRIRRPAPAV
ncbi:MAG: hypothetical protein E6G45_13370 [Actinobacteria bacterium]|nr:MAG: hypothetical protein E6G45_13370 [Actinomycetota bacterium]